MASTRTLLSRYRQKRDFTVTAEPSGAQTSGPKSKKAKALSFVIQKHAARRLHYDFRLELDGVLKSWAVPKGPSLDPAARRLAVEVEDHPVAYGGFEGTIPEGQYGGGTVLLWDRGSWTPLGDPHKGLEDGNLKFALDGEKLRGNWALVRMQGRRSGDDKRQNWLLLKERDALARPGSDAAIVDDNPLSVESGRDLDAIARDAGPVWQSRKAAPADEAADAKDDAQKREKKKPERKKPEREKPERKRASWRAAAKPVPENGDAPALGARDRPQLARLADDAPEGDDWLHEIKYDGYRLLIAVENGRVALRTRGGLDWTAKFPELATAVRTLPADAVLDGEIVHFDDDGITDFSGLQAALAEERTDALVFMAFDLLHHEGVDLRDRPLVERKAILKSLLIRTPSSLLNYGEHQLGRGPDFLSAACRHGLEGIVSKRCDAPYRAGRGKTWVKSKCVQREELVIVGYTEPAGSREHLGALLTAYHDEVGKLVYAGRVGTGFTRETLAILHPQLEALARTKPPLTLPKDADRHGVHWVEPQLVAEIGFGAWTADNILRHARFLGLRADKPAGEVVRDRPLAIEGEAAQAPDEDKPAAQAPRRTSSARTEIAGIRISHGDKPLYPAEGLTKAGIADYYIRHADLILPHLADRPLSILRCPDGIEGERFMQKHPGPGMSKAIHTVEIAEAKGPQPYLMVRDAAGLAALVQMGGLELHPWGATADRIERPDRLILDLDPDEALPWTRLAHGAVLARDLLADLGLASFIKTTGGKGLHLVAPIRRTLDWDSAKTFTKEVAETLVAANPALFTATLAKKARSGRIFIDYLRNGRGATAVAPYSTRARPGATVAVPIEWEAVETGKALPKITVETLGAWLKARARDPWAGFFSTTQSVTAAARRQVGG